MSARAWAIAGALCALGVIGTAWLSAYLELRWFGACLVQGVALFIGIFACFSRATDEGAK